TAGSACRCPAFNARLAYNSNTRGTSARPESTHSCLAMISAWPSWSAGTVKKVVASARAWSSASARSISEVTRGEFQSIPALEVQGEWLPGRDSNPDRQIQNLLSYH